RSELYPGLAQEKLTVAKNADIVDAVAVPIARHRQLASTLERKSDVRRTRGVRVSQQELCRRGTVDADGVGEARTEFDDKGIVETVVERLQSPRRRVQSASGLSCNVNVAFAVKRDGVAF